MDNKDKEREIIIASGENSADALHALVKSYFHDDVVIVGANKETVSINGIEYVRTATESEAISPSIERMSLAAKAYGRRYERNRPDVDIVEEYKLVQAKKSKLGRSDRDWVELRFHRLFKLKEDV